MACKHLRPEEREVLSQMLAGGASLTSIAKQLGRHRTTISPELRQAMTLDNGCEFAEYEQLETTLGLEVFFTDPHAPWQKGTNENTNGLTRQFFPKGTNFNQVSRYKVARTETLLNEGLS